MLCAGRVCCIPTAKGPVTVSVFKNNKPWGEEKAGHKIKKEAIYAESRNKEEGDSYMEKESVCYTAPSDTSFIVKKVGGHLHIVRSVYGNIYQEYNPYGQKL